MISPDNKILIGSYDREVGLWDITNGQKIKDLFKTANNQFSISGVSLSPDEKSLIAGYSMDFSTGEKKFMVWDTNTWELQRTFSGGNLGPDFALSFSPDGKRFAASSGSGIDRIHEPSVWDFSTGKMLYSLGPQPWMWAIAYDPSGKYFAVGGSGGGNYEWENVTIYDANTGKPVRKLDSREFAISTLAFSPDGSKLAAAGNSDRPGEVRIWDLSQP